MLELYQSEGCPHSSRVRETLSALGISYVVHNPRLPGGEGGDIINETTHNELMSGGEGQLPYLVDTIRNATLYESNDIIDYLKGLYT